MSILERMRFLLALISAVGLIAAAPSRSEVPSAFSIAKSGNHNQVHYAVGVDSECAPAGNAPVHAYWRMLERSADATEPLLSREERAYGVGEQHVTARDIHMVLRAMPKRAITIQTGRDANGSCTATANMTISGVEARLTSIFVKQKLLGVDYVELNGVATDGRVLHERVSI